MAYGNIGQGGLSPKVISQGDYMGAQTSAPPRIPIISEQMNILEQRTEALSGLVSELDVRISPVLQPDTPQAAVATSSPMPSVAMGASLAQMNERLSIVAMRLRNVIDRVEL